LTSRLADIERFGWKWLDKANGPAEWQLPSDE
jgi:hypothetical protein